MQTHLVLVGGGHAHMQTLAQLDRFVAKGVRATVIGPSRFHYYSGMGPGMLGGTYTPQDIRFATQAMVEKKGGRFIMDSVVGVHGREKRLVLAGGETLAYDLVSFNTGSEIRRDHRFCESSTVFGVKPIEGLINARRRTLEMASRRKIRIAIVGGGPSAAEIAGNLRQLTSGAATIEPDICIFAGRGFMSRFPESVRQKVRRMLAARKIEISTEGYATAIEAGCLCLENDRRINVDLLYLATGVRPPALFTQSGLPIGPDGGLRVNAHLQCVTFPEMFGGGDCIYFEDAPLDKVGVYAVRQNPILCHNLMAFIENRALKPFNPGGNYLLAFNLGFARGVVRKGPFVLGGRAAFIVKDIIDRRFMHTFQAHG